MLASLPVTDTLSAPAPPSIAMCSLAAVGSERHRDRIGTVSAIHFQMQIRAANAFGQINRGMIGLGTRFKTTFSVLVNVLTRV